MSENKTAEKEPEKDFDVMGFDAEKIAPITIKDPVDDGRVRLYVELRVGKSGELNERLGRIEILRKELAAEIKDLSDLVEHHPMGISLTEE